MPDRAAQVTRKLKAVSRPQELKPVSSVRNLVRKSGKPLPQSSVSQPTCRRRVASAEEKRHDRAVHRSNDEEARRHPFAAASAGGRSFLEQRAVQRNTLLYYRPLIEQLTAFIALGGPIENTLDMDARCVDFCDMLYFEGHPGSLGLKVKAAIADRWPQYSRHGAEKLPRLARALQAWNRLSPGRTRAPVSWWMVVMVAAWLARQNRRWSALAVVLIFVGYLRPSEALDLLVENLLPPTVSCPCVAIEMHPEKLGKPSKTGFFDDGVPLDAPYAIWLGPLLLWWCRSRLKSEPLLPISYRELKEDFEQAMGGCGLADPSLYRLRHGGASFDRAHGHRTLKEVKKRGRWAADSSVRRYERATRLQAEELKLSQQQQDWALAAASSMGEWLRGSSPLPAPSPL